MPMLKLTAFLPCASMAAVPLLIACSTDKGDPLDIDEDTAAALEIPVGDELQPWLAAGEYEDFEAESEVHASSGPHGRVRTFLSPGLSESLAAGGDHPLGVAAVKELYDGDALNGWVVSVKIADDSAGGENWYWYEVFDPAPDATPAVAGTGANNCVDCHGSGGQDYILTPYPLE